ncbi:MAG: phosphoribosylamine--glycine ligase [Methanoregulaceae archaeon PtaB.Bin009]|jgi:phosphoribosylamine--glycine ligase|nr:MAG: phosphoribosylamine--glycine ligase [Methanoregulaceae archaeon PtaB.Bin009]OPY37836.1 MAG: phosphoribosylamine--glycine ligase [Methanoregulaceae archaeon PtaU1.Bin066]
MSSAGEKNSNREEYRFRYMTMKILVVGGGGREHAISRALSRNNETELYAVMARENPGISRLCRDFLLEKETRVDSVSAFAKKKSVDYAIIGPEAPLEAGVVDRLEADGIPCMGPTRAAARLETDKAFCRVMMEQHGIAGCPRYRVFRAATDAVGFLEEYDGDLAIKPAGLTGGKGVRIMGEHLDRGGAIEYIRSLGSDIVLEEKLVGEEFTLQAFVDGTHLVPMPLVQDHKRAFEGDEGPNTGGMGSYSMPDHGLPFVTGIDRRKAFGIMQAAVSAMEEAGTPYRGILYGQFMNTRDGPMVIEFNARFGDPEAMNVLSLLESDLPDIIERSIEGTLSRARVRFLEQATVCKYLVPEGYPESPIMGQPVSLGPYEPALLYYANVEDRGGTLYTQSSRTMAFVGMAASLAGAEEIAERAAEGVKGKVRHRRDIGSPALLKKRVDHMRELR